MEHKKDTQKVENHQNESKKGSNEGISENEFQAQSGFIPFLRGSKPAFIDVYITSIYQVIKSLYSLNNNLSANVLGFKELLTEIWKTCKDNKTSITTLKMELEAIKKTQRVYLESINAWSKSVDEKLDKLNGQINDLRVFGTVQAKPVLPNPLYPPYTLKDNHSNIFVQAKQAQQILRDKSGSQLINEVHKSG